MSKPKTKPQKNKSKPKKTKSKNPAPEPKPKEKIQSLEEFAEKKLEINCWSKMKEIFAAVESGERKVLIRSCHGAGKTTALAAICNWYFLKYPDSIVLTTASSWNQVKRNLWGEIRRQARAAKLYKNKKVKMLETKIMLDDKHFMIGISPDIPENAMGFHAPHILVAVDEATGVTREIYDALMGNLSGENAQIVLICNPIDKSSFPYDAERSGEWRVIHISAFDHPNVKEEKEIIPGAVTQSWIFDRVKAWSFEVAEEAIEAGKAIYLDWVQKWFRKTELVQSRIMGEWSQLDGIGFIPLELIERYAQAERPFKFYPEKPVEPRATIRAMGVDISRHGADATVYAFFDVRETPHGPGGPDIQLDFKHYYDDDLMTTADRIEREYHNAQAEGVELVIALDDTGLGGGVTDALKRKKIPCFPVNFAQTPKKFLREKNIANARAEMYFLLAEELRDGKLLLAPHKRFHQELAAVQLDISKTSGLYKMEDKALTKKRLGRSPDYADATALARYGLKLWEITKREHLL